MKTGSPVKNITSRGICIIPGLFSDRINGFLDKGISVIDLENALKTTIVTEKEEDYCIILSDSMLIGRTEEVLAWIYTHEISHMKLIVLSEKEQSRERYDSRLEGLIHLILPFDISGSMLADVVRTTLDQIKIQNDRLGLLDKLGHSYQEIQRLTMVGQSLSSERDFDTLLELILLHAREIVGADSGSIYIAERNEDGRPLRLRFKKSSLNLETNEFVLPINKNSIAGYVAYSGELLVIDNVYELTGQEDYKFNNEFDAKHGYYSKSMMVIPMMNHHNDVIGVIQLINRQVDPSETLTLERMRGGGVTSFSDRDQELAFAMAGQAAVAIENNELIQSIQKLFEGFVRASVSAIEQRDPTTSGHSFRVAEICVGMAQTVDRVSDGIFKLNSFSVDQIREIRYAALLHDFGKVGVREHVLIKSNKLYEHELENIQWRCELLCKQEEIRTLQRKVEYLKEFGSSGFPSYEANLDADLAKSRQRYKRMLSNVEIANRPTILDASVEGELHEYIHTKVKLEDGRVYPFLTDNELVSLSVQKGSLNENERMQIMLHVSNTYNFLIQIPWTKDLGKIPDIAFGHHEKLDGSGYPFGLEANEISVQTRIMTIADIFDALTATDRPYKKEVPVDRAIDILWSEVKENRLDKDLMKIFVEAEIYRVVESMHKPGRKVY